MTQLEDKTNICPFHSQMNTVCVWYYSNKYTVAGVSTNPVRVTAVRH